MVRECTRIARFQRALHLAVQEIEVVLHLVTRTDTYALRERHSQVRLMREGLSRKSLGQRSPCARCVVPDDLTWIKYGLIRWGIYGRYAREGCCSPMIPRLTNHSNLACLVLYSTCGQAVRNESADLQGLFATYKPHCIIVQKNLGAVPVPRFGQEVVLVGFWLTGVLASLARLTRWGRWCSIDKSGCDVRAALEVPLCKKSAYLQGAFAIDGSHVWCSADKSCCGTRAAFVQEGS
eukprot:1316981-Pyramimonas_sp.AAC.1